MPIESGPTTERIVRNMLFFLMIAEFGASFLYDGYVGYEAKNFEEHLQSLDAADRERARAGRIYEFVNTQNTAAIDEKIPAILNKLSPASQRAELERVFGGPPSFESNDAVYYFGPDYRIKFVVKNGMLRDPVGKPVAHKMTDLRWQKVIGWLLSVGAVVTAIFLASIIVTKCVLDEQGIRYRFKGRASWDEMMSLESTRFQKKGWIDLVCVANGKGEKRIRLDEYHLKRFADIIAEISRRKGFEDPVAIEKAMKAKQAEASAT
ncbi:MAG: hypothetical protein IPK83_13925 [Planctomycetes bacterium]|nr:hypothetical protein [Planctomycetota bacterium]